MSAPADRRAKPDCMRCGSYFVTHVPERPHGCRAFGFTSARLPRDEVRLSTGEECAAFEPRPPPPRAAPRPS